MGEEKVIKLYKQGPCNKSMQNFQLQWPTMPTCLPKLDGKGSSHLLGPYFETPLLQSAASVSIDLFLVHNTGVDIPVRNLKSKKY